ncbi:MAG: NAD-dependent epimerase/dehydratase family protein [Archangium sp.]
MVFGAGQIGSQVAKVLTEKGLRVVQVRRSGVSSEAMRVGDLSDPSFAADVAKGARAIIHTVTPPYHQWGELLIPLNDSIAHAAKTSGAPLIVLDNVYAYGEPSGPLTETSPIRPTSRKGELRAKAAERIAGPRVAIARAADFYGPGVTLSAIFNERFIGRAWKGKPVKLFGPPEVPHSYSYAPDVAAGLVTLALDEQPSRRAVTCGPGVQCSTRTASCFERRVTSSRSFGTGSDVVWCHEGASNDI